MLDPDEPIKEKKQDELRRLDGAQALADIIVKAPSDASFVIGIEGSWGSGKTSFVNLVKQYLRPPIILMNYNPWYFTDLLSLLTDFFLTLSRGLGPKVKDSQKFARTLGSYVNKIGPLFLAGITVGVTGVSLKPVAGVEEFFKKRPPAILSPFL